MRVITGLLLVLLGASVFAEGKAATLLQQRLSLIDSLVADFNQLVVDNKGDLLERSSGQVHLQRPWRLRWQIAEPYRYLLVSDGETLWRWDEDLEQLNEELLDGRLKQTPAAILGGDLQHLQDNYRIALAVDGDTEVFTLRPLSRDAGFSRLELRFLAQGLQALSMLDELGQHTEVRFSNIQLNPSLETAVFSAPVSQGNEPAS